MRNLNQVRTVLLTAAILLSGCHRGMADLNQSQAASILADHYETVFYAKADLVKSSAGYRALSVKTANSLRIPFSDLLGSLQSLGDRVPSEVLDAANFVFVGAKDFQAPHGLGAVQSQFCFVVALRKGSQFDIGNLAKTSPLISSVGEGVWTWETKPTEGQSQSQRYFALQSPHAYLLVSSDIASLRAMSGELGAKNRKALQLPKGIPDWQTLSQHDLWGYRRYRHSEVQDKNAAGTNDVTSTATALLFYIDAGKKDAMLRLLASDGSTAQKMNAAGKLPQLRAIDAGSWETNVSLADESSVERVLAAMWLFGFGVYL